MDYKCNDDFFDENTNRKFEVTFQNNIRLEYQFIFI